MKTNNERLVMRQLSDMLEHNEVFTEYVDIEHLHTVFAADAHIGAGRLMREERTVNSKQ
jgi:hypothetical protein